jgi:hypothetical protein
MSLLISLSLALVLGAPQTGDERLAYAREGDRIEQEFLEHRDRLTTFFSTLRSLMDQQPVGVGVSLPRLEPQDKPPSASARFGYGVLPKITDAASVENPPVSVFSYSWPITDGYIAGERVKLDQAEARLREAVSAASEAKASVIAGLVTEYRTLLANHRTIDQYIQYNQFWQRSIAQDRPRFDQLTKIYDLMKSDEPNITQAIREVLGRPEVPAFIKIDQKVSGRVVVRVPVYTDIDDPEFLAKAKSAIEDLWQVRDGDTAYSLNIEFRQVQALAQRGDRVDVRELAGRLPEDGAVLTTGAQTTHSLVGRYLALGPGDLSTRTLAHEFGHVLGFRDGYIRGYRDLGEQGFEILELTSVFDDIMSAPREGHVQVAHFKLLMDALSVGAGR